jgi:hypothetical protein
VSLRGLLLRVTLVFLLAGCAQTTTRMQVGEPLKVNRGMCLVNTSYEQNGKQLNWSDTTRRLSHIKVSEPHVSAGNSWAIGSIVTAVVASPAIVIGADAKRGYFDMDDGVATGLLVGGIIVGAAGFIMCVVSDGEYAAAGDAYNESLGKTEPGHGDDGAPDVPETSK